MDKQKVDRALQRLVGKLSEKECVVVEKMFDGFALYCDTSDDTETVDKLKNDFTAAIEDLFED